MTTILKLRDWYIIDIVGCNYSYCKHLCLRTLLRRDKLDIMV